MQSLGGLPPKTMHLVNRLAAMRVAMLLPSPRSCCKTDWCGVIPVSGGAVVLRRVAVLAPSSPSVTSPDISVVMPRQFIKGLAIHPCGNQPPLPYVMVA